MPETYEGLTLNVWMDDLPSPNRPGQQENANFKAILDVLVKNSSIILKHIKVNTANSGSDTVSAKDYAGYSWRPVSSDAGMTVTITDAQEGMSMKCFCYGQCGDSLVIGGCSFTPDSCMTTPCGEITYDNGAWRITGYHTDV
jgi:hypothetical protein